MININMKNVGVLFLKYHMEVVKSRNTPDTETEADETEVCHNHHQKQTKSSATTKMHHGTRCTNPNLLV